ncbi:putative xylulokinase [Cutaneotrichosporon oleaginosum]|uniref:Xylulose kinase n=1 Tax=Cutaneotrichosporon oleaginosum TaxID=879819 RepID=A0A0J0XMJ3_9TREE|nr:putative xylulokinase [Cutaneotrichosporon oleaginosum]KLT42375.1 putative xylulokinase [Cutaneotrichosporon oleaginosum]TXT04195.1 hypothetical protein COLE_07892 [Cutaneotrichosporon oleaginosum]
MQDCLFLGLDSSTQALKASLLDEDLRVLSEAEVRFDADLSHFKTRGGVLHGPEGSGEVFSPVMQPVEALDLLLDRMKAAKWPLGKIKAVSAAGQQHASVYWSKQAGRLLSSLDAGEPMAPQLQGAFSRAIIPNWQDSSTVEECKALEAGVGGPKELARITGSKAHTRFTASQILRFRNTFPDAYGATDRISLVSSYITTLLCADGDIKGIDESDACGMNLWDMESAGRGWSRAVLDVIAPGEGEELARKLGRVETDGGRVVGNIGRWFVERHGFDPKCVVVPGTGDNPATFLSFSLREREGMVSLGTSDVVLVSTAEYSPHPEFHAFFHPAMIAPPSVQDSVRETAESLRYFNMLVYKNGSLAREHVRDKYFGSTSWDEFNAAVERLRPQSGDVTLERMAFWWLLPAIIPSGAHGVYKYIGSDAATAERVDDFSEVGMEALAILECQMMNYASRSSAILSSDETAATLARVYVAGGAARNKTLLNVMADAMGCPVSKAVEYDAEKGAWGESHTNACSVGVAYKAAWGWVRSVDKTRAHVPFDDFVAAAHARARATLPAEAATAPGAPGDNGKYDAALPTAAAAAYKHALPWWRELEKRAVMEGKEGKRGLMK